MTVSESPPAPRSSDRPARGRELLEAGLSLLALSALALAQPLFSLLSDNATFFVVRGSTAGDIVTLAVVVALGPPLVLFLVELLVQAASPAARRVLHLILIGLLGAVFALPILKDTSSGSSGLLIPLALLLGVAAAATYARGRVLRLMLNVLSPLPVVVAVIFLFFSPVSKLVVPEKASAGGAADAGSDTPVVMIVFDEFDGDSLRREDGRLDAARFPNLAALAKRSDWFPNASSIADVTELAVPALLSGRLPEAGTLPIQSDHPDNIFTLLGRSHDMNVTEQLTTLCPEAICGRRARPAFSDRMSSLGSDLRVVWLHQLLPDDLRDGLPSIDRSWGDFEDDDEHEGEGGGAEGRSPRGAEQRVATTIDRSGSFRGFLSGIRPAGGRPQLSLLHILLPHVPYEYLPSGRQYSNADVLDGLVFDTWFDRTEALRSEQRYTLQLQYLDRLIGDLIRRLRATGLYDRSMVVITADHGVSFRTGGRRRTVSATNAADITPVPLFLKTPGQRRGRTIDRQVSTLDILPTVGDVLGVRVPWADGRSALDARTDRERTVIYSTDPRFKRFSFATARLDAERRRVLAGQTARVGQGREISSTEPGHELIGRRVSDLAVTRPTSPVAVLDQSDDFAAVDLGSPFLPAFVTGHLEGVDTKRKDLLAVALNGRIAAVTRTYTTNDPPTLDALLPESQFRQGFNRVEVFQVTGPASDPLLASIAAPATGAARGPRLESRGTRDVVRLTSGRRIEVSAGTLEGFVEDLAAADGRLEVKGWAWDPEARRPPERILAFANGTLVAEGRPAVERPDLRQRYGPGAAHAGYRLVGRTVKARQLVVPGALRVVAVSGPRAAELKDLP